MSSASELKYTSALKAVISKEFSEPSPEFVKLLSKQVYDGMITNKLLEQFTSLVKRSISGLINDRISDRLKTALNTESASSTVIIEEEKEKIEIGNNENNGIVTTEEELEGFRIVRAILCCTVDVNRIAYRDAQTYFAILFDDNNRKPICRLYFNSVSVKYIATFDAEKKETKNLINCVEDIYNYAEQLRETVKGYLEK